MIAVIAALLSPAHATDRPAFDAVVEEVGLSSQQRDQVRDITYRHQSAKIGLEANVKRAELDLRHLMDQETLDEKSLRKAVAALNDAEAALRLDHVELVIEMRKVLTAEQWRKLDALHQRHPPEPPEPPRPPAPPAPPGR